MLRYDGCFQPTDKDVENINKIDSFIKILEEIYIAVKNDATKGIICSDKNLIKRLESTLDENEILEIVFGGELNNFFKKKTFYCLLCDFCVYINESVEQLKKFNPQVAFTLARKPLIDDAYYLMKLLVDSDATIDLILNKTAKDKEITSKDDKEICEQLNRYFNVDIGNVFHELRYSKETFSIKSQCDRASHIVTSKNQNIETNKGELNFIFTSDKTIEEFSTYYCLLVSLVLGLMTAIVIRIFELFYAEESVIDLDNFIENILNDFVKNKNS